jgi:hypothetical protein
MSKSYESVNEVLPSKKQYSVDGHANPFYPAWPINAVPSTIDRNQKFYQVSVNVFYCILKLESGLKMLLDIT